MISVQHFQEWRGVIFPLVGCLRRWGSGAPEASFLTFSLAGKWSGSCRQECLLRKLQHTLSHHSEGMYCALLHLYCTIVLWGGSGRWCQHPNFKEVDLKRILFLYNAKTYSVTSLGRYVNLSRKFIWNSSYPVFLLSPDTWIENSWTLNVFRVRDSLVW